MTPAQSMRAERINSWAIALIVLIGALYVFPRWADPNQNSRLNMVFAVVDDGTFQIDKYVSNTVDYAKVGDHYYSDKAPGAAFLVIPLYAALKPILETPVMEQLTDRLARHEAFAATLRSDGSGVLTSKVRFAIVQVLGSFVVAGLATALAAVLIYRWTRRLTPAAAPRSVAALSYGLLTPAYAYSNALYGHQLAAALLIAAFCLLPEQRVQARAGRLLLIGALLGYSVVSEYPAVVAVLVLGALAAWQLWTLGRFWSVLWIGVGGAAVAAGWMSYNTAVFGGPLELGYSHSELWVDQHATGFMSLTAPGAEALLGITISPFRGLFFYAPWLLLALPGALLWARRGEERAALVACLGVVGGIFLFNASSGMWWGGFAVGPRYLLPMLPFLVILCVPALERLLRGAAGALMVGAALLWSLLATWGLALAEQAYPSDALRNPLLQHALPNWQRGNIARNAGTILGLDGAASLLPLLLLLALAGGLWLLLLRRRPTEPSPAPSTPATVRS